MERLQGLGREAAHAGLGEQAGKGFGGGSVAQAFERKGQSAVVGQRDGSVERFEFTQQGWQGAPVAGAAQRPDHRVDRCGQVSIFGHAALQDAVIPLGDAVQRLYEDRGSRLA